MSNDVVLGSALRTNLLSLQRTQSGIDKIQNILATGLKVSSALDNPQNFFAAKGLNDRASDLSRQLDGIGQSISTIQAADKGASAVGTLIDQAESLASSAQEEISENGSSVAKVVGNVDLSGVTDLSDLTGISATDTITISYTDKNDTVTTATAITTAADFSADQLVAAINDVGGTASSTAYGQGEVLSAKLNEDGFLEIESKTGGGFQIQFEAAGAADVTEEAADNTTAATLGFGGVAQTVNTGGAATEGRVQVSAVSGSTLVSGELFDAVSNTGYADASDSLETVLATNGGANRFTFGATTSTFTLNVDGEADVTITGAALNDISIQGFVDTINDNSEKVEASYDQVTGRLSIEAIDASVKSIQFDLADTSTTAAIADFDFGVNLTASTGTTANSAIGENFYLGAANETLAQIQTDYNEVRNQIDSLVGDSGYRGVNLLKEDTLTTFFDEDRDSSLNTVGRDLSASGLGISEGNFTSAASISSSLSEILGAKSDVRSFGNAIANSLSIVQTREDFTKDLVAELKSGAEKLTVADQNEEGAKLLSLQTRQQLGVTSLSLAVQSQQSVLRLF